MDLLTESDFESRNDYVDYLYVKCEIGLTRDLIYGRITRGWPAMKAISTRKITKPGMNHPYKKQYVQHAHLREKKDA